MDKVLFLLENTTLVGEYVAVLFDDTTDNNLYVTQGEATVPAEPQHRDFGTIFRSSRSHSHNARCIQSGNCT